MKSNEIRSSSFNLIKSNGIKFKWIKIKFNEI